jgi:hypothetical protein
VAARRVSISLRICRRRPGSDTQISFTAIMRPVGRCSARRTKPEAPRPMICSGWSSVKSMPGSISARALTVADSLAGADSSACSSLSSVGVGGARWCSVTPSLPISKPPILKTPDSPSRLGEDCADEPFDSSKRDTASGCKPATPRSIARASRKAVPWCARALDLRKLEPGMEREARTILRTRRAVVSIVDSWCMSAATTHWCFVMNSKMTREA